MTSVARCDSCEQAEADRNEAFSFKTRLIGQRDAERARADQAEADAGSCARALRTIANDLRAAGADMPLVRLSEEGVTPEAITLADELWLVALQLDGKTTDASPTEGNSDAD